MDISDGVRENHSKAGHDYQIIKQPKTYEQQVELNTKINGTTLIISKKPGNTGISRDIRTEFTTDLLLSD